MPTVECPNCVSKLDAPSEAEGRTIRCPECGEVFVLRFPARSEPVVEIYREPEPPAASATSTDAFTLADEPTAIGRPNAKAKTNTAGSTERLGCSWLILELAAVLRDMHTIVTCRVQNPEEATLEITLAGPLNSAVIEATFGPNCPDASEKAFETGRFPVGTPVSATLFDSADNARYRAQGLVEPEPTEHIAESPDQENSRRD
jgi:hypothetical protein